ncbi:histidine kinase [Catenulispora acidiphila DSM 44928]|uniref:histidine kinase n=1 Tax=Catenulispora acidiphila (strain DSM 44928 / JCM 14897 / NBRC 102108 / NRRL B-24433 / ID139908) TaxID=479433 RepID=C7QJ12_CATAD|nr:sensor histidine kinase [Catenulispora acidiphila]ACU69154.1 histidine kinase [Catenulispora acidiphila DSM 44928]
MITTVGAKAAARREGDTAPTLGPGELLKGPFTGRALRQQGYLLVSFVAAFVQVLVLTVTLALGGALVVLVVGLPLLLAGLVSLRWNSRRERLRILRLTGERVPEPYREPGPSGNPLQRLLGHLSDPATWRDLVHLVVASGLGLGWFLVAVGSWVLPLGAVTLPFWYTALPEHRIPLMHVNGSEYYISTLPSILAFSAVTLAFVWLVNPTLLELGTRTQTGLGRALLGLSRLELDRRETALRTTRSQAVSAAEAERRRIERDLHDGAQQRLVALAMDLGRAKSKLKTGDEADSEAAAQLVAEAHEGVKLALSELRDLARGIHPAVLTDRGLDAALSALAGRSPIPVEVDADLPWRPSPEVESAAYFVASEALANMAKHAHATRAWIELEIREDHLRMIVGDNGVGGAQTDPGGGLDGLSDRIAPLDGILSVSSPLGGPTQIIMEMPCPNPSAS